MEDFGIAVFLDVLGAKVSDTREAERLLKAIELLLQRAREGPVEWSKRIANATSAANVDPLRVTVVGDAILLTWKTRGAVPGAVARCGVMVKDLFVYALSMRLPLRGAIGVGDILYGRDENIVLGSGITDAANWYERADIMGVIATPLCGAFVEWLAEGRGDAEEPMSRIFVRYGVPLKGDGGPAKTAEMWALAWPDAHLQRCRSASLPPRKQLLGLFTGFDVPPGAEQKYAHAEGFYDFCVKKWDEEGTPLLSEQG
jgi:hypothetical protein